MEKFRELQPDAVIFVQGIMKVAKEKSDKDPIFNNVGIEQRNERIAALADGKNIFYLDMNEVVCDEEGNLKSSLTSVSYTHLLDFLRRVKESLKGPKSSCPSPEQYMDAYEGEADHVYAVTLSGGLSGSYNSAVLGKNLYRCV